LAEHALTRSVRDSAALLDATSGVDIGDPYWAPPPKQPFIQEVGTDPGSLRIAFTTKAPREVPVHDDCVKAAQEAAALCNNLGHKVEEIVLNYDADLMAKCFFTLWCGGGAWVAEHWERRTGRKITPDLLEPLSWDLIERGRKINTGKYLLALEDVQRISREVADFFSEWDVIITPTLAEPPVPLGTFDATSENPLQGFIRSASFMPFTAICNMTGQPAMSVPLCWNEEGLPIGTQFIGRVCPLERNLSDDSVMRQLFFVSPPNSKRHGPGPTGAHRYQHNHKTNL
jgi:amidase